jgi:DinB family protein
VDRRGLLKRLDKAWNEFQEARAGLSEAQLMIRGVTGKWSVRDILAHVTTWEEEALKHLPLGQFQEETRFRHRLRLDTYSHYPIHAKAIWKWREKQGFGATKLF